MEIKDLRFRAYDKKLQQATSFLIFGNRFQFFDKETKKWEIDDAGERFVMRIIKKRN